MRSWYRVLSVVLVLGLLSVVMGCKTPAGRSAGQVVDDATITTVVKAKYFDDKSLSGLAISVKTFEGEVTLTGAVNSQREREHAASVARSVDGVRRVNNLLTIK